MKRDGYGVGAVRGDFDDLVDDALHAYPETKFTNTPARAVRVDSFATKRNTEF